MSTKTFIYNQSFQLESGTIIPGFHLAYTTHGELNAAKNNTVWVFHALTANSDPAEWWNGLVGDGKLFNPEKYFIVCVNIPGSCYGSISPLDINTETGSPYYHSFPFFTTKDMVKAYQPLKEFLGISKIHIGVGGSMGGQQLLEWAIEKPDAFEFILPIATNAQHSPWGIAFNASQRMAIEADITWKENKATAGIEGMKVARSIALLSYRHYETYGVSQMETDAGKIEKFKSESYQRYQGEKLASRFNAFSYYKLSLGMDSHHVGRGRASTEAALKLIKAKTLVIGISSDLLFPVEEQKFLAANIHNAAYEEIHSFYGHDGFLLEYEAMEKIIRKFLNKQQSEHLQKIN